eukprot:jgi/Mesvir1/28778/Mv09258-RA.2
MVWKNFQKYQGRYPNFPGRNAAAAQLRREREKLEERARQERQRAQQEKERAQLAKERAQQEQENRSEAGNPIDDAAAASADNDDGTIYTNYMPVKVKEGVPHPDACVETQSLGQIHPPNPTYSHYLKDIVANGVLSSLQLETVVYANMRFGSTLPDGSRAGFFLGDGAGVGKGRQVAALIVNHMRAPDVRGSRVLWVSVSTDLKWDADRDLKDVDPTSRIPLYPEGTKSLPFKGKLSEQGIGGGVLFITYSLLVSARAGGGGAADPAPAPAPAPAAPAETSPPLGVAAQMDTKEFMSPNARFRQILEWLQEDPNPLIIFDECHKAKNLLGEGRNAKSTKTARAVVHLQKMLPNARVLYCSATGASSAPNLAYMTRLGSWGFPDMSAFINAVDSAGLGAMEILAMGLKATGCYLSRTLSYAGAEFCLVEISLDARFKRAYDRSCQLWMLIGRIIKELSDPPQDKDEDKGRKKGRKKGRAMAQFWGAHQRFFRSMLVAAKVPALAQMALQACADGMCAVIGLQSTGEAAINAALADMAGEEMDDFISAPRAVLVDVVTSLVPVQVMAAPCALLGQDRSVLRYQTEARNMVTNWRAEDEREGVTRDGSDAATNGPMHREQPQQRNYDAEPSRPCPWMGGTAAAGGPQGQGQEGSEEGGDDEDDDVDFLRCRICGAVDEAGDATLDCDRCQKTFHPACVGLDCVPDEDEPWFCPTCEHRQGKTPGQGAATAPPPSRPGGGHGRPAPGTGQGGPAGDDRSWMTSALCVYVDTGGVGHVLPSFPSICFNPQEGEREATAEQAPVGVGAGVASGGQAPRGPFHDRTNTSGSNVKADGTQAGARGGKRPAQAPNADDPCKRHKATSDAWGKTEAKDASSTPAGQKPGRRVFAPGGPLMDELRHLLLDAVDHLSLPPNPLDHLKDLCGGAEKVAEMTGRPDHVVRREDGSVGCERRVQAGVSRKLMNMNERDKFMDGFKHIAIISEAASCGISLQADRRRPNQRRRCHFTLELPWSAERALQQFGRTHRANQTSAPMYKILVTDVGGERRFASSAAKRLQSLGALLKGDRRDMGAGRELKAFDIDNKYGQKALKLMYTDVLVNGTSPAGIAVPSLPNGDNFHAHAKHLLEDVGISREGLTSVVGASNVRMDRFLNRLLGIPLEDQTRLFALFSSYFDKCVADAKAEGTYHTGMISLKADKMTTKPGYPRVLSTCPSSGAQTSVVALELDCGMPFAAAQQRLREEIAAYGSQPGSVDGFWVSTYTRNYNHTGQPAVLLVTETKATRRCPSVAAAGEMRDVQPYRPYNSMPKPMGVQNLKANYRRASPTEPLWDLHYKLSAKQCMHGPQCKDRKAGRDCEFGMRCNTIKLLSGAVLLVWRTLQKVVTKQGLRAVEVQVADGSRLIGFNISDDVLRTLEEDCANGT